MVLSLPLFFCQWFFGGLGGQGVWLSGYLQTVCRRFMARLFLLLLAALLPGAQLCSHKRFGSLRRFIYQL